MRAWICLIALLMAGCAGYRLGPTNGLSAGARSVQVNPFQNKTIEPRLIDAVTSQMRKQIQQDGTYRLETQGEGDIIVTGVITKFERNAMSFQPNDVLTVRDYGLTIIAHITARDRLTGKLLMNRDVVGRTTIRAGADLANAERQAVPMMAEDLARRTTTLLVNGLW